MNTDAVGEVILAAARRMREVGLKSLSLDIDLGAKALLVAPTVTEDAAGHITTVCACLSEAWFGASFARTTLEVTRRKEEAHAQGRCIILGTTEFKNLSIPPGKSIPDKGYIQHNRVSVEAAHRVSRALGPAVDFLDELSLRLSCIDGYGREFSDTHQKSDTVNKARYVCLDDRSHKKP